MAGKLAEELDTYFSLSADMSYVLEYLKHVWPGTSAIERGDFRLIFASQGQWHAAVVTYARCFAAGRRRMYADAVQIPTELEAQHRAVRAYRNNFSHPPPPRATKNWSPVRLSLNDQAIHRVSVDYGAGFITPSEADLDGLRRLASHLERAYRERSTAAERRILEVARQLGEPALWQMADRGSSLRVDA